MDKLYEPTGKHSISDNPNTIRALATRTPQFHRGGVTAVKRPFTWDLIWLVLSYVSPYVDKSVNNWSLVAFFLEIEYKKNPVAKYPSCLMSALQAYSMAPY